MSEKNTKETRPLSRREFLRNASIVVGSTAVSSTLLLTGCGKEKEITKTVETTKIVTEPAVALSKAYLLFDPKKCAGCGSCMLACSLVHEGKSNPALSRIQIQNDSFGKYPTDVSQWVCQQCENPECYNICPDKDETFCIDPVTGVRYIDEDKCDGCGLCAAACAYQPSRIIIDREKNVALKCDLCRNTPYWDGNGKQACVEACPTQALKFTSTEPVGYEGYRVNLRGEGWAKLELPRT